MKKLVLIITIISFGLVNFAQVTDSTKVTDSDTKKKNKTVKLMVDDEELINVDVDVDDIDLSDIKSEKSGDTTIIRVGKKNITIVQDGDDIDQIYFDDDEYESDDDDDDYDYKSKKFKGHWSGMELGLNNYLNSNNELALPADGLFMELNTSKSIELSLNFAEKAFPVVRNRFGVVTGMGIRWNNYHFDKNIKLNASNTPLTADNIDVDSINFTKNRLGVTYLTVPILVEYQIPVGKKHKPIYFSTGVIGGLKLGANLKQKYVDYQGSDKKDKFKKDYNISPYTAAVTARIGYKNVNLFANYSLVPLFEKNKGPELYPFTIGISMIN